MTIKRLVEFLFTQDDMEQPHVVPYESLSNISLVK